jgi:CRISPR-associated protein Cas1
LTKTPIPIEDVDALYLYGEINLNTWLLNFLAQKNVTAHVFNYYGYYAGSYYSREYLNSGFLLVQQVANYQLKKKHLVIARELIKVAAHGMQRNAAYYQNRGKQVAQWAEEMARQAESIETATAPAELMGIEGRMASSTMRHSTSLSAMTFRARSA